MIADSVNTAHRKDILIVEDDESIRETFKLALEVLGYRVSTASNGKEGIEKLLKMPPPCVILLDLMMPVMDGWGFIDALHRETDLDSIPVVVVTAFGDHEGIIRARKILQKPLELDHLSALMEEYCA